MPWQPAINKQRKAIRKNFIKEGKGKQFRQIFSNYYGNQLNRPVKIYIKKNPSVRGVLL
jgi:hypothetical protein